MVNAVMVNKLGHLGDAVVPPAKKMRHVHAIDAAGRTMAPLARPAQRRAVAIHQRVLDLSVQGLVVDIRPPEIFSQGVLAAPLTGREKPCLRTIIVEFDVLDEILEHRVGVACHAQPHEIMHPAIFVQFSRPMRTSAQSVHCGPAPGAPPLPRIPLRPWPRSAAARGHPSGTLFPRQAAAVDKLIQRFEKCLISNCGRRDPADESLAAKGAQQRIARPHAPRQRRQLSCALCRRACFCRSRASSREGARRRPRSDGRRSAPASP